MRNNVEKKQELQINENRWIGLALYIFLITFSVNSHDSSLDEETSSKGSSTALNQSGSETESFTILPFDDSSKTGMRTGNVFKLTIFLFRYFIDFSSLLLREFKLIC